MDDKQKKIIVLVGSLTGLFVVIGLFVAVYILYNHGILKKWSIIVQERVFGRGISTVIFQQPQGYFDCTKLRFLDARFRDISSNVTWSLIAGQPAYAGNPDSEVKWCIPKYVPGKQYITATGTNIETRIKTSSPLRNAKYFYYEGRPGYPTVRVGLTMTFLDPLGGVVGKHTFTTPGTDETVLIQ